MARKVLFVATVDYHFKAFHLPVMQWFQEQGWEVHVAARGDLDLPYTDTKHAIPFQRSPFSSDNRHAYRELKALLQRERFDIIHCHTPVGGAITRLAAREARKFGTKVLYTAHGFHFCKGAPLVNWLVYYPIERMLSRSTDCLITINQEDYTLARRHGFKAAVIEHVHGVGVDPVKYAPLEKDRKAQLRAELGFSPNDLLLFYAAEFNGNKNQRLLIEALAQVKKHHPQVRLLLAGTGGLLEACRAYSESLGLQEHVVFLGYRTDIERLLPACDIAVASSRREGLPVNIMEAMSSGLPVVARSNRGHLELVDDGVSGYLVSQDDPTPFAQRIVELGGSQELRTRMGQAGQRKMRSYQLDQVRQELTSIYGRYMTGGGAL